VDAGRLRFPRATGFVRRSGFGGGASRPKIVLVRRGTAAARQRDILDPARRLASAQSRCFTQENTPEVRNALLTSTETRNARIWWWRRAAGRPSEVSGPGRSEFRYAPPPDRDPVKPSSVTILRLAGGCDPGRPGHMGIIWPKRFSPHRSSPGSRTAVASADVREWAASELKARRPRKTNGVLRRMAVMRAERDEVLVLTEDVERCRGVTPPSMRTSIVSARSDMVIHARPTSVHVLSVPEADTAHEVVAVAVDQVAGTNPSRRGHARARTQSLVIHGRISSTLVVWVWRPRRRATRFVRCDGPPSRPDAEPQLRPLLNRPDPDDVGKRRVRPNIVELRPTSRQEGREGNDAADTF